LEEKRVIDWGERERERERERESQREEKPRRNE
jgi:hypothetical protein